MDPRMDETAMSRREVLYASGAVAFSALIAGLAGCAGTTSPPQIPRLMSRMQSQDDPNRDAQWDWTVSKEHTVFYSLRGETPQRLGNVHLPFYTAGHPLNTYQQDMWPQDGWMLAYKDFGTPVAAPPMPFFALYNKHRGIFRIMLYHCHFPDLKPGQIEFSGLRLGDEHTTPSHPYSCG